MNFSLQTRLISWRLWQRIQRASRQNPLYARSAFRHNVRPEWAVTALNEVTMLLFASPLAMVTFPVLPLVLLVVNLVYGMRLTLTTSAAIYHERERYTLELLTLIPPGKNEAIWLLCLGAMHCTRAYENLTRWRHYIYRMIPMSLCVYGLLLLMNLLPGSGFALTFRNGLFFLVIIPSIAAVLMERDNTQSVVTAALVGLVSSSATLNRENARMLALTTYAAIQIAVYSLLLMSLSIPAGRLFPLHHITSPAQWGALLIKVTGYLLVVTGLYILMRDAIIRLLWRLFQYQIYR